MQVVFESRDPDAALLRELAERRLRFVLRRLTWLVPRAKVQLTDINGPRGGVDKQCQVELKTGQHGTVLITAVASDWRGALEQALARAAQSALKALRRQTERQQPRLRAAKLARPVLS